MDDEQIYQFEDYKEYLASWLERDSVLSGRGGVSKLAGFLKVHPSFISQVLKRDKDFSQEQAFKLADYFGFRGMARDYFLNLVLEAKAGSYGLKKYYTRKLAEMRKESKKVKANIGEAKVISEKVKSQFYSDAIYAQVRLMTSIPRFNTAEKLSKALNLPLGYVNDVVGFLLDNGLIKHTEGGQLEMGVNRTHLAADSPLIGAHHRNWRNKVLEHYGKMDDLDLAFTAPLTISSNDFEKVRQKILELIKEVSAVVDKTAKEEDFVIFNIDWVRMHCENI